MAEESETIYALFRLIEFEETKPQFFAPNGDHQIEIKGVTGVIPCFATLEDAQVYALDGTYKIVILQSIPVEL
jgi:hypothetical protein